MDHSDRRSGPPGQVANELESVLTAVVTSADEIADGELSDSWRMQQELGALENALTRALALVHRLGGLLNGAPVARLSREDFAVGSGAPGLAAPVFVGRFSTLLSQS